MALRRDADTAERARSQFTETLIARTAQRPAGAAIPTDVGTKGRGLWPCGGKQLALTRTPLQQGAMRKGVAIVELVLSRSLEMHRVLLRPELDRKVADM